MTRLPIDSHLPEILSRVREARAVVVTAPPGSGKTTRVPPALAGAGPVIVLQPRRVAARSLARWIAAEQGWTLGKEVGWHVRFEPRFSPDTRVLLATEGILTARLQQDPLLSTFRTIVLDEFHERSVHADLGIALARQAWLARSDLRLVIMSATLDTSAVSSFLGDCPVVSASAQGHPLDVRYAPGQTVREAVVSAAREANGQVLCFLPGAGEIGRTREHLTADAGALGLDVVALHGSQDAAAQDAAIAPVPFRRVILATNIAETSLTVPGVSVVVDSGLHKVARYDPDRGIDSLETERISRDSADQRAGRAARLGPGLVVRLWDASDRLRPFREPEIHRIDLSGPMLDVLAWGADPRTFEWFERPSEHAIASGFDLLERLGAISSRRVTDLGRQMQRLPLHPRLARILIAGEGAPDVALACALLAERHYRFSPPGATVATTTSDLLVAVERARDLPGHVRSAAAQIASLIGPRSSQRLDDVAFRQAVLRGFPDRVGRRRAAGSPRVLLCSGHGAALGPESGVREGEFVVAMDVTAGRRGEGSEARIRSASAIERDWLQPTGEQVVHTFDEGTGSVKAVSREYYGDIVLIERVAAPDPVEAGRLIADAYLSRELPDADRRLLRRLRFAGHDVGLRVLIEQAAAGCRSLGAVHLANAVPPELRADLNRLAPETISLPSGRDARLEYQDDGSVVAAVKLQELFGLGVTPRVGVRGEPVVLSLLAPNGRPVQVTRDLKSFWERTYPEVRKELRGRYPKHPWPEDPWTATPTARTTRGRH